MFAPLVVDNFAGGGGASLGIEQALGRPVDVAINHDADAVALHQVNHPSTKHLREDVWALAGHSTARMTAHYADGHEITWADVEAGL